jgi:hypothetical protein
LNVPFHDAILSFADKYQRGSKKSSGMAALDRDSQRKLLKNLKKKNHGTCANGFQARSRKRNAPN